MKFDLTGYDVDNLLKKMYIKKIPLHNVNILEHNHISFEIEDNYESKIKRYIKNFKVKKTAKFFKRIPAFALANLGIILAVFLGSIFFMFVSPYTWKITIYGTNELSPQDIIQVLKNNGIKTGKINLQSSEEIETILLNNYNRIAQVSVIRQGTHIIINLSEKLVYTEEVFEPITAKFNGIVTSVKVITGTLNVKVGDYVNVGDSLVLPFNINADGEQVSVKPVAEIKGKIYLINTIKVPKEESILSRTGNKQTVYRYKLFNFNLYYGKNKNRYNNYDCEKYNETVSTLVPFSRDVYTYYELALTTITHDFDLEKQTLIDTAKNNVYSMLPQYEKIVEESVTSNIVDDNLYIFANLVALSLIA